MFRIHPEYTLDARRIAHGNLSVRFLRNPRAWVDGIAFDEKAADRVNWREAPIRKYLMQAGYNRAVKIPAQSVA